MPARFRLLIWYLGYWLAFFTALRLGFLAYHRERAAGLPAGTLAGVLRHGLALDLSAAAYLSLIPFLLIALSTIGPIQRRTGRLLLGYTLLTTAVLALMAAVDLEIFQQWGRRIDAAVLEYLPHPREVWASAGAGPRWLLLGLSAGITLLFAGILRRVFQPRLAALPPAHPAGALPLAFCALLLVIPARGGIQQIPINQSSAYFSAAPFANQAALNVGWNFFDSWIKGLNRRVNPYLTLPPDSARMVIRSAEVDSPGSGGGGGVLMVERPNIVLIVWESFTARAVERLGGVAGATPEFDRLAASGLLFRRFYAAGDRTEKGLAALLAGAPTVPTASILMVPSKAATLPTLSTDLAGAGYTSAFYYGGELGFANIGSFVVEGGFGRVLSKPDFPSSSWSSLWGAHDDAVAERVLADLEHTREPFFATWLTLSSHEPFDVPGPARIPGEDGESRFLNSLAFTDHVLGDFLRQAAQEPWWARTLVVIVADHSKKLERTDATVPYKSAESWYHIPMLWTGGALARTGAVWNGVASQVDLAPTLLGLLRLPGGERYRFGRNLFGEPHRPWAYYSFDDGFGLVTESGGLVWEHIPNRITSSTGRVGERELRLGRAMLQLTFQDYLDR